MGALAFILPLFRSALPVLAGLSAAAALVAFLLLANANDKNTALRADLSALERKLEQRDAQIAEIRDGHRRALETLQEAHARSLFLSRTAAGLKGQITHAPEEDDAPVAPVLQRTLVGLRELEAD